MKKLHVAECLILKLALHWRHMPLWSVNWWGKTFELARLIGSIQDENSRLPKRVGWRKIKGNSWDAEAGVYRYGTMPMTVGERFSVLQALQAGNTVFEPLRIYFHLRRFEVLFAPLGKIAVLLGHIRMDLHRRDERDRRTVIPLTDLQRQAGIGRMNHGLFGIIDFIACRNHLTYKQVYDLSDMQLYGILQIEHDRALAARMYQQVVKQKQEQQAAVQRGRFGHYR